MLRLHGQEPPVPRPVLNAQDALAIETIAQRIHVEDDLYDYAVALAAFTRSHPRVALGASPRATLQLVRAAKARAALDGRDFVLPDDVMALAPDVLRHRIVLSLDAGLRAVSCDALIADLLAATRWP